MESENPEGFTKDDLQNTDTMIFISLFDKQMYLSMKDGQQIRQEENRFLGQVVIPLSTILHHYDKMDFNFKLERPLVLPAYRVLDDEAVFMTSE